MRSRTIYAVAAVVALAGAAGAIWWVQARGAPIAADAQQSKPAGAAGEAQASAVLVTASVVQKQNVPVTLTVNGSVMSLNSVDVRPQVTNVVQKVHVKEGDTVRVGQPLFSLDTRADLANLQKAKAQQLKDEATLA